MITQQVVTYIKEQLSRGTARDKIRSNLLAAGWVEEDVNQAFSFAEPNVPNAALKIAPSFAVENEVVKETPIDKTTILKKDEPLMPILKRDPVVEELKPIQPITQPIQAPKEQPVAPVEPVSQPVIQPAATVAPAVKPIESINNLKMPEVKMAAQPAMPVNPAPILSTVQQTVMSPAVNSSNIMPRSSIQVDTVRTFGDEGETKPISTGSSSMLKGIAVLLAVVLVIGNLYLWMVALPLYNKNNTLPPVVQNNTVVDQSARVMTDATNTEPVVPSAVETNPVADLLPAANKLQTAASAYFAKYNSYGGASMAMGSCNTASTVFMDIGVKGALTELSTVTGRVPQCALVGDDSTSSKIRTVTYIVYVPMEDGGFCVDSTGAAMAVSKIPTGLSCTAGL